MATVATVGGGPRVSDCSSIQFIRMEHQASHVSRIVSASNCAIRGVTMIINHYYTSNRRHLPVLHPLPSLIE